MKSILIIGLIVFGSCNMLHAFWQVSDVSFQTNGCSLEPGFAQIAITTFASQEYSVVIKINGEVVGGPFVDSGDSFHSTIYSPPYDDPQYIEFIVSGISFVTNQYMETVVGDYVLITDSPMIEPYLLVSNINDPCEEIPYGQVTFDFLPEADYGFWDFSYSISSPDYEELPTIWAFETETGFLAIGFQPGTYTITTSPGGVTCDLPISITFEVGLSDICPPMIIEGDFDGNGLVTTADFLILIGNFGCNDAPCQGDMDGNGNVNTNDLLSFLSVF